ncbi:MAG TPA: phosphoribosylglycinamide formyltransferase [Planctomycetota bacterium]|nr:phosphoribosylglycinamide formyltransferase [Planctomycetota bacterium]
MLKLAVLLSGSGRTLDNFYRHIDEGKLPAEVSVVVGSRPDALGLEKAARRGTPTRCIERRKYADAVSFSAAITDVLRQYKPDLVLLAGFMHFYRVPDEYAGRAMNIHPALIPAFCGKGFYGHHVHEAVLKYGAKVSGCTVHFADNIYDHGPIIIQRVVPVLDNDTPDALAARVFEEECIAYPEAIRLFGEGRLEIRDGKVRTKGPRC